MANAWKLTVANNGTAELLFDLPGEATNILSAQTLEELNDLLRELRPRKEITRLIVKSAKPNVFIADADLAEFRRITTAAAAEHTCAAGQQIMDRLEALPFPSVAVISGACLGAGLELALACSFRVATDEPETVFGLPQVNLGILPAFGGTQRLPRLIGTAQALPIILSRKQIDAKRAYRLGLVDRLAAEAFLDETVDRFVQELGQRRRRTAIEKRRRSRGRATRLWQRTPPGQRIIYDRCKREVLKRTAGHHPAPLQALEVVRRGTNTNLHRGLALECEAFGELAPSRVTKNLIQLALTQAELRHQAILSSGVVPQKPKQAAVLGAGVMGGSIAWLFSNSEIPVTMKDLEWARIADGYRRAAEIYREPGEHAKLDERETRRKMHYITGTLGYRPLRRAEIVIEAVAEDLQLKRTVLAELEVEVHEETVIATNTSSLTVAKIAAGMRNPHRFAAMHFFKPVSRMPLVEIVAGEQTDPETLRRLAHLAVRLGRTPIVVGDCPGFLMNRMLVPCLNEAAVLVEEGVEFAQVDRVFTEYGMPMGPFRWIDEIGIDAVYEMIETLAGTYGERMRPSSLLAMVTEEMALKGRKGGKGFYIYGAGTKAHPNGELITRISRKFPIRSNLINEDILRRPLYMMLNEAARCLEDNIVASPQFLDMALIMGTGFPAFRGGILRWADELEPAEVIKTMAEYTRRFGKRYTPSAMLSELGSRNRFFYDPGASEETQLNTKR